MSIGQALCNARALQVTSYVPVRSVQFANVIRGGKSSSPLDVVLRLQRIKRVTATTSC